MIACRPTGHKLVACRYYEDGDWYRARVMDFSTKELTVRYVDYASVDVVPFGYVHSLESAYTSLPFQVQ